jgi:actin-related protein
MRKTTFYSYEETKIILDLGPLWIKCGFGGEAEPRHVYCNHYSTYWKGIRRGKGNTIRQALLSTLYELFTE